MVTVTRPRLNYTFLETTPDDGNRYELYDGELVVSPPPGGAHQVASSRLVRLLDRHVDALGYVVHTAGSALRFDDNTTLEPDILVMPAANEATYLSEPVLTTPQTLVVEIISPSSGPYDLGRKMDLYARFGQRHYWVVHPTERWIAAFEASAGRFDQVAYADAATFSAPPFPALSIDVTDLFS